MRTKILIAAFGAGMAFLLATNPVIAQAAGFITSGDIVNNTIKSKDVKDNSLKGKDVKDGKLTGADVGDGTLTGGDLLVRASVAADEENAVVNTDDPTTALSTSITAPTRGYLLITASTDSYDYDTDTFADCFIEVDNLYQPGSERVVEFNGDVAGTNNEEDCSTNVGSVVAAGPHVVEFVVDPDADTTTFDNTTLEVLFVPFNGVGATPAKPAAASGGRSTPNR